MKTIPALIFAATFTGFASAGQITPSFDTAVKTQTALPALLNSAQLPLPVPQTAVYASSYESGALTEELERAGYQITASGVRYGVPYVGIKMPVGFKIYAFCREIPSLKNQAELCKKQLGFFNTINPFYEKTSTSQPWSIEADILKIPMDLNQAPEIFPSYNSSLSGYPKYLHIDAGKSYLALYESGQMVKIYPISAGAKGHTTPSFTFKIGFKDAKYWSRTYGGEMPWSLQINGGYFIHGGALPGQADSHGCIRMLVEDAKELFYLVDAGTPGIVTRTQPDNN